MFESSTCRITSHYYYIFLIKYWVPKKMPDLTIDMLKEMHGALVTFCGILSSIRMKLVDFLLVLALFVFYSRMK